MHGCKKTPHGWIPSEWDIKTLGELGSFSKGKGISNSEKQKNGYPCITYGDIYTKYDIRIKKFFSFIDEKSARASQRIYKGCILFAGSGETLDDIGKCVAFDNNEEAYAGGDIIIFTPRGVNVIYLSYLLNSHNMLKDRRKIGQGHSVVHIYSSGLGVLNVHLPPLSEQGKIAEILSIWDEAIANLTKLVEEKEKLKQCLMQQLLTGKLRFKSSGKSPWKEVHMGELLTRVFRPIDWTADMQLSLVSLRRRCGGLFRRPDVLGGDYKTQDLHEIKTDDFLVSKRQVSHGAWALVLPDFEGSQVSKEYAIFVNKSPDKFHMPFFAWLAQTPRMIRLARVASIGVHIEKLIFDPEVFLRESILIPPSLAEQKQIADALDSAHSEILLLRAQRVALDQQKRGLMQKLLTGEVRVRM
ncbi:MAG: hypothetical protein A2X45_10770 [Lentisphaerae bacterium GWF2_50_93]|nr:MAG: hypothetical protein A2X45_10770 [Lentisphaerae bacterium GWF2_50_93]